VDDALGVGELQALADLLGDGQRLRERQLVLGSLLDGAFDIAAGHELGDHVGLAVTGRRSGVFWRSGFALTLTLSRQGEGTPSPSCIVRFLAEVEDGDDVGMGAEAAHGLRLPGDALAGGVVEAVGLYQGEGDVAVQRGVVGEVDALLAALAEEALDGVAAIRKGLRHED